MNSWPQYTGWYFKTPSLCRCSLSPQSLPGKESTSSLEQPTLTRTVRSSAPMPAESSKPMGNGTGSARTREGMRRAFSLMNSSVSKSHQHHTTGRNVYSSSDSWQIVTWMAKHFLPDTAVGPEKVVERLKAVYNELTETWVLWLRADNSSYVGLRQGYGTSPNVTGLSIMPMG